MIPLFALLLAYGCQKRPIQPLYQPELNPADRWSASDTDTGDVPDQWWVRFEDPVLAELVTEGLSANYNLKAAAARLEAAAAQARVAGADLLPQVSAGLNANGQRQNFIGFPIPGSEGQVLSRTFKSFGVSLDASWEPDVWNRIAAGEAAAIADWEAAAADLRAARLSLTAQIGKAWYAIVESREQLRLAEKTAANYRDTSERIRGRYAAGLLSSLDLRLSLSSLHSAEALVKQRQQQLDAALRQLEILLGKYPRAQVESSSRLPELPSLPSAGVPAELVSRRPDLVAAERRMLAAGARWEQSRLALYPSFKLTGRIGTSADDFLQAFSGDFLMWNLAGNILQPVFQGGRLRAQIQLADARSKESAAQWASSVLRAFAEVESALAADRLLQSREGDVANAMTQAGASLKLAENRYASGLEPFVTVLEAQRRSLEAESQLLTVRRQRLDTRIDLHLALGGNVRSDESGSELSDPE
jgi:multidrug efflux system outer membrane protein